MPSGLCHHMARQLVENAARERGKSRTMPTSATICAESQAGGTAGRNSLGEASRIGFQVVAVTFPGLDPIHMHLPVGTVPVHTAEEPSALAESITRAATFLPRSRPA